jgi:hypothetical protein
VARTEEFRVGPPVPWRRKGDRSLSDGEDHVRETVNQDRRMPRQAVAMSPADPSSALRTVVGSLLRWWTVGRHYRPERKYMRGGRGHHYHRPSDSSPGSALRHDAPNPVAARRSRRMNCRPIRNDMVIAEGHEASACRAGCPICCRARRLGHRRGDRRNGWGRRNPASMQARIVSIACMVRRRTVRGRTGSYGFQPWEQ